MTAKTEPLYDLDPYTAVAIAEGFEEADSQIQVLQAWSYIGRHKLHFQLQGFFGRTLYNLVHNGLLNEDYTINYEQAEELF